jgi:regulator of protease activity HflC (stomatin/prohibitin superfamily)
MATITRYPFVRHLSGAPTTYVQHVRAGTTHHEGVATAFWFRPLGAALSEVPVDDRELPMTFHGRTSDYFDVTVQGTITFRVLDPAIAARRLDFSIDPTSGLWRGRPLDQLAGLLTETAQQQTVQLLTGHTLTEAVAGGVEATRNAIAAGLAADQRLTETGVAVIAVRILAIRPDPEVEKALQTPAREVVQQEADKATFERRALAVEREAAIGENELENQIELARREEQLVAQRGQNDRRTAELRAATEAVRTQSEAASALQRARADAEGIELIGAAEASAEAAHVAAYADLPQAALLGLALKELAANMPALQSLVVAPDVLAPLLARLGAMSGSEVAQNEIGG